MAELRRHALLPPAGAAGLIWPLLGRLFPGVPLFDETLGWGLAVSGALFAAVGVYNL